jgi:hypothetical protein
MVDVHIFYNRKINPLFANSGFWRLLLGIFKITNVTCSQKLVIKTNHK